MAEPSAPPKAPRKKPGRRPYFCMIPDMNGAVSMEPMTVMEMGRVAQHGSGLSIWPERPPRVKWIGICAPRMACAATRMVTLRRAVGVIRSFVAAVMLVLRG